MEHFIIIVIFFLLGEENGPVGPLVRLFIPGVVGIKPILGLKALPFQKVRIAAFPDQFNVTSPGLNNKEGTYSFESIKYPNFYLQRNGRDIYLEVLNKNSKFCKYC